MFIELEDGHFQVLKNLLRYFTKCCILHVTGCRLIFNDPSFSYFFSTGSFVSTTPNTFYDDIYTRYTSSHIIFCIYINFVLFIKLFMVVN